jgi:eukaryotic-like serine/threonine-protein kinase
MHEGSEGAASEAQLFDALCELEPAEQAARLRTIVRDDAALAARLRRLLAIDADYAEHTVRAVVAEDLPETIRRAGEGDEIGAFRLVRQIGRGGMGVVYLAERRSDFAQTVAIKIMPRFAIDARSRERFGRERRLLAQLRHPNVCSIVDGGELDDGTPWLAMEYVRGETLCAWCAQRATPLRERVELFLQLCAAVQYAHSRLVIHRDLKDSNVLIETLDDGRATVKLLDFGIAKSLETTEEHARTAAQDRVFSPLSAAPEQLRGEFATIGADVYALGGLLYQLLCGALPFASAERDPVALQRAILETVPPKMSDALRREIAAGRAPVGGLAADALRGELDAIAAQCLRKAPDERYPDIGALMRDLQAWLSGHPISISADDRLYRLRKFLRRNRLSATLVSATAMSVVAALGITLWQAAELREQRDAAETARQRADIDRDRARAVADFMRETFEQADPGRASASGLLARDLIERGKRRLRDLDDQPNVQAELALLLAESDANLGLLRESDATLRAHVHNIETLAAADPKLRWRAKALQLSNAIELAPDGPHLDADLTRLRQLAATPDTRVAVAQLQERLLARRSRFPEAAQVLEDAWRRDGAALSTSASLRLRVDLGNALLNSKRDADAHRICEGIDRQALGAHDPALQIRALRLIVRELQRRKNTESERASAIAQWRRAAEDLYGEDSLETASAYVWMINATPDPSMQDTLMAKAYAIQRAKLPAVSTARARAEYNMAWFFLDLRKRADLAEPHLAQAVTIGRQAASRTHGDVRLFEATWAKTLNRLRRHQACLDRLASPPDRLEEPQDAERLSALRLELARAAQALRRPSQARAELDAVRQLWRILGKPLPARLAIDIGDLDATVAASSGILSDGR